MTRALLFCIRTYQRLSKYKPRVCRYEPTCSEYAAQAITKYGPLKGIVMGIWRLLRCNPLSGGGLDPVR